MSVTSQEKPQPPSDGEWREVPHGWIKEYDYNSNAWYYVDTTRSPARSIWVHPHDDPLFLRSHPQYKLSDEFPPKEKQGILGKLKANTIGRSEKAKKEAEWRAQENDFHEWKERLSRQNAYARKYGSPPQWSKGKKAEMSNRKSNENSVIEHTNGHDHGHDISHAVEGAGGHGVASMAVHGGAVAGGEATGGDSGAAVDTSQSGGGIPSDSGAGGGDGGGD